MNIPLRYLPWPEVFSCRPHLFFGRMLLAKMKATKREEGKRKNIFSPDEF